MDIQELLKLLQEICRSIEEEPANTGFYVDELLDILGEYR